MSCSEIEGDVCLIDLPPIPLSANQMGEWSGRTIEVLATSHTPWGDTIILPDLPRQIAVVETAPLYQRVIIDLTHVDLTVEDIVELVDGEFEFAENLAYIGKNYKPDATVEDILNQYGLMFDEEQGEVADCKSAWKRIWDSGKKIAHKLEKRARKTCKKTVEFVKENKKEILIGVAIVVTGAVVGTAAAVLLSADLAAEVVTATVAVAASEIQDAAKKRREEDEDDLPESTPSTAGPDPQPEPEEKAAFIPNNRVQKFLDDLSKLAPAPVSAAELRNSIYRKPREAPEPVSEIAPIQNGTPPQPNIFQEFFDNLLKPSAAPDPRSSIYRPEFMEKQQQPLAPASTTEPVQAVDVPSELASLFGKIQEGLVTTSHAFDEAKPINGIVPLDPFLQPSTGNGNSKKRVSPLSQKSVEREHVSVPVDWIVSLPPPPDVGIVPVLSPGGNLNWLVISADWHKLDLAPEELQRGIVHFDEHLREFIPKKLDTISLITSQNGINVTIEEFVDYCKADNLKIGCAMVTPSLKECPHLPLFVGIYNPTEGVLKDAWGAIKDMIGFGEPTPVVRSTGRILAVLGNNADAINHTFKWLHISHSRAGAILNRMLETNPDVKKLMFEHGLSVALGPALPISNKMAIVAINLYSEKDYVTKWFALPFLNDKDYDIRFLESKYIGLGDFFREDDEEPLILKAIEKLGFVWADHFKMGETYNEGLKDTLIETHGEVKFYDGQEHR